MVDEERGIDIFEPLPLEIEPEVSHERPDGVESGGRFCMICGEPLPDDNDHDASACEFNPILVAKLRQLNGW